MVSIHHFVAKTILIDYYIKKMGAELINQKGEMIINGENARKLYERYYGQRY